MTGNVLGQHWFWSYELAPYINDDWKITRKLTANLGLRYDFLSDIKCYSGPCYGVSNPLTATANATEGLTLTPYILAQSAAKRNFEPRVGFAYDLFGDHKTSIRGGFAIFHTLMSTGELMEGPGDNYPFIVAAAIAGTPTPPSWFPCAWDGCSASTVTPMLPPASVGPYQAYNTDDSPRLLTWNGDIQRELLKGSVLQVGYVGSRGIHQSMYVDVNSPTLTTAGGSPYTGTGTPYFARVSGGQLVSNPVQNPVFGPVLEYLNTGLSRYNSLQVSFDRQLTGYWQLAGQLRPLQMRRRWGRRRRRNAKRSARSEPIRPIRRLRTLWLYLPKRLAHQYGHYRALPREQSGGRVAIERYRQCKLWSAGNATSRVGQRWFKDWQFIPCRSPEFKPRL